MKITVTKSFRGIPEGRVYDFELLSTFGYIIIVGENGCGKSSIFQALRGTIPNSTNSLRKDDFQKLCNNITVEHDFEKIFFLDAVMDNGNDFLVAFDASHYIDSGGFAKKNLSHGQGALSDLNLFINKIKNQIVPGKTLVVLDEVDHGLSLVNQTKFVNAVDYLLQLECNVIAISHNPFLMIQCSIVYNFADCDFETSNKYIQRTVSFDIKKHRSDSKPQT
jgi:predicted ATPase